MLDEQQEGKGASLMHAKDHARPRSTAVDIMDDFEQLANEREKEIQEMEERHRHPQGSSVPDDTLLNAMQYADLLVLVSRCGLRMGCVQDEVSAREMLRKHREQNRATVNVSDEQQGQRLRKKVKY